MAEEFSWKGRLSAEMASYRLLVLDFVRGYVGHYGDSPSYAEIAAAAKGSVSRTKKAANSLVRDGLLIRREGQRGLWPPDRYQRAVRELRAAGFIVDEDIRRVAGPLFPLTGAAELDYLPSGETLYTGQQADGETQK